MPGAIVQRECVDALMVERLCASVRSGEGADDTSQKLAVDPKSGGNWDAMSN